MDLSFRFPDQIEVPRFSIGPLTTFWLASSVTQNTTSLLHLRASRRSITLPNFVLMSVDVADGRTVSVVTAWTLEQRERQTDASWATTASGPASDVTNCNGFQFLEFVSTAILPLGRSGDLAGRGA